MKKEEVKKQEVKKQEDDHHSKTGHGHGHNGGHHHDFRGIEQWLNRLDHPERAKQQLPDQVIAALELQNNDVVVDIGAGTGYFALRIAAAYPQVRVIAADAEAEMIAYLQAQSTARQLANLEAVLTDPARPKLPVRADLALLVDTLHHIHNRGEYLRHLCENMATGSRIAVIDYALDAPEGPPADHRISIDEVADELKQVGYTLAQDLNFLPHQYFLIFKQA